MFCPFWSIRIKRLIGYYYAVMFDTYFIIFNLQELNGVVGKFYTLSTFSVSLTFPFHFRTFTSAKNWARLPEQFTTNCNQSIQNTEFYFFYSLKKIEISLILPLLTNYRRTLLPRWSKCLRKEEICHDGFIQWALFLAPF